MAMTWRRTVVKDAQSSSSSAPAGVERALDRAVKRVLSAAQREALATLAAVVDPATYLAGGLAVALRLQHRRSQDLDLFLAGSDPVTLTPALEEREVRILSRAEGTLHLDVGGVPASILRYRYPLLEPPERVSGIPLPGTARDVAAAI
jgi:hypothetical protein